MKSMRVAVSVGLAHFVVSLGVLLAARAWADSSVDANIGAGLLAFLPSVPWGFLYLGLVGEYSSWVAIVAGNATNSLLLGLSVWYLRSRRDNSDPGPENQ